ncbi:hypothetical protein CHLRE_04g217988v5 [Chlamydomonas reinhardtii]|uniref:Uncharacterized protein n=1 Tax=Chlamydomonas reinhardtii TaxID=3055 RepID=A0A2K3DTP1_CHLRE|nr:uncharacterized protein CHLRE_10g445371v5 [Chlamydomonas reinhardtii]XP_042925081.1 uncharacterized protein CHLRE_04g217988v5 [Chlamydomonas reinhardtii]PNW77644.1 hypothetical protein CHLRE_10g445371v5 [Chlamydomonas reinhardtii]PNW83893.1 hypothetical protein CHLRE_04g217988v5 [Chlamydomonas reinhardtii]
MQSVGAHGITQASCAAKPDTPGKQHPRRVAFDVLQLEAWYRLASARAPCITTKAGPAVTMDTDDEERAA